MVEIHNQIQNNQQQHIRREISYFKNKIDKAQDLQIVENDKYQTMIEQVSSIHREIDDERMEFFERVLGIEEMTGIQSSEAIEHESISLSGKYNRI